MPNLAWLFLFCKLKDASDIQSDAVLNYGQWFYYGGIFFSARNTLTIFNTTGYLRTYC